MMVLEGDGINRLRKKGRVGTPMLGACRRCLGPDE